MNIDGARSPANHQFLHGFLRHGSMVTMHGTTIEVGQTVEQGVPCFRLAFLLPQACQLNSMRAIAVLVPNPWVGTGIADPITIFYALIEEIIGWLANVGPKHTLIRLYNSDRRQPLPHSPNWNQLHSGFISFIDKLRPSRDSFINVGQLSGAFGVIEVSQARTPAHDVSADFIVTLTLSNRQQMSLFLPRSVAQLPFEWMLDWLEVQNTFSSRV
jgi:hypothetical protein